MLDDARGFQSTALFFETRAKKARNLETESRLAETAAFYRSLAAIVPSFPSTYKQPPRNVNRWTDRADVCRALAECVQDTERQRRLASLADDYDRMAGQRL